MQIETTVRSYLILARMAAIQSMADNKCSEGHGEIGSPGIAARNVKGCSCCGNSSMALRKLTIELPYDPAILPVGRYQQRIEARAQKDVYAPMLMAALLTIAKKKKIHNSNDGQTNGLKYGVFPYAGVLLIMKF